MLVANVDIVLLSLYRYFLMHIGIVGRADSTATTYRHDMAPPNSAPCKTDLISTVRTIYYAREGARANVMARIFGVFVGHAHTYLQNSQSRTSVLHIGFI